MLDLGKKSELKLSCPTLERGGMSYDSVIVDLQGFSLKKLDLGSDWPMDDLGDRCSKPAICSLLSVFTVDSGTWHSAELQ